ncbi:MAG: Na+/H+ antiporter NhaA [Tessaracoccus sp.]|uniref:Na+/H+ antiporter NhaA n=1 Tax=Tessaracoccus sp. TaxID=1971211 RepID=UPI001ECC091F|nr:Na+/H+ antiporter NhaA [Tessaracoccus sp.]MBK7820644.1 Na+/H+ antiporter NhaA [Tessaracoccus sp.]
MTPRPRSRIVRLVTRETTGGLLLLLAAAVGFAWANSPWRESFAALSGLSFGPAALHLNLPLSAWAADGLLAVFFFVVGVELKHELVAGSLRQPKEAGVPIAAAVGGMAVPAVLFSVLVVALGEREALHGWAVPTATDIAFALAVLAVLGRGLPRALRTFLLTLAVVDDLLAIVVIAVFYTDTLHPVAILGALVAVVGFGLVVRSRRPYWWLLVPLAAVAWGFVHASGVHATIAGVVLGLTVPAVARRGETAPRTHAMDAAIRPWSAGVALPIFAFFASGITVVGAGGHGPSKQVLVAVLVALVAGKVIGVLGTASLVTRLTPLRLPDAIGIRDLLPIGFLCGIGFTVSLLIAELSFADSSHLVGAKVGVLVASLVAAGLGGGLLRWDARKVRTADMNEDGVPDIDLARIGDEDTPTAGRPNI